MFIWEERNVFIQKVFDAHKALLKILEKVKVKTGYIEGSYMVNYAKLLINILGFWWQEGSMRTKWADVVFG